MASSNPKQSLYPEIIQADTNPELFPSSSSKLYPSIDMKDLVENLFPGPPTHTSPHDAVPSAPPLAVEEELITIPGAILHLIDKDYSVELACGDLSIVRLRQGDSIVAILARISDQIQWPLARDEAAVKLDDSHYFFSLHFPGEGQDSSDDDTDDKNAIGSYNNILNYGLTIMSKGQEKLLNKFDEILGTYSSFSEQRVSENLKVVAVAKEVSPEELKDGKKKEMVEENCMGYWTTLAPNVEDYSGSAAKLIAAGSGQLIKGILWCGDVTVDRLKWGEKVMKERMTTKSDSEINPDTLRRIRRYGDDNF